MAGVSTIFGWLFYLSMHVFTACALRALLIRIPSLVRLHRSGDRQLLVWARACVCPIDLNAVLR